MSLPARARRYGWRLLIAIDQLANALAGGNPDETLSSRGHKARERWLASGRGAKRGRYLWGCILCGVLDAIWENHCAAAVERDESK